MPVPKTQWWPFHCVITLPPDNTQGTPCWWLHAGLPFLRETAWCCKPDGLQMIWVQKREQSEFYFFVFDFWTHFPVARKWRLPQQSSQLLSLGLDYVWTQSLILSKTQLMRREMKSALSPSVLVVICDTLIPLLPLFIPPPHPGSVAKGADKRIH